MVVLFTFLVEMEQGLGQPVVRLALVLGNGRGQLQRRVKVQLVVVLQVGHVPVGQVGQLRLFLEGKYVN